MIKISIIMPLYNAEKYLEECLRSIFKQTLSELELICINDASTDGTKNILEKYMGIDSRIKVISNTQRSGAAYSRNRGIYLAKGKYLSFLDGDDFFDASMLELAYEDAEKYNADITMFNAKLVPSQEIYHLLTMPHGQAYISKYCTDVFSIKEQEPYDFLIWIQAPWNKIYRRKYIIENKLEFQNLSCANDVYFVNLALMLTDKVHVINDSRVMVYVRSHGEATRISYNRDPMCIYWALEKVILEIGRRGKLGELFQQFYWRALMSIRSELIAAKDKERARQVYDFMKNEGIDRLIQYGEGYYHKVDLYAQKLFNNFKTKTFESNWYREENILKIFLEKKNFLIEALFQKYKQSNSQIAIWGAGRNGRTLVNYCNEHMIELSVVIDKYKGEKKDALLGGYPICTLRACLNRIDVIIIASEYIVQEVQKEISLNERKVEVIDINQFLEIY